MNRVNQLVECVLELKIKWPFSVTSWGRTFYRNKLVGGVHNSEHLMWNAMDVVLDESVKNEQFEIDAKICGLKAVWEGDHYHLSLL